MTPPHRCAAQGAARTRDEAGFVLVLVLFIMATLAVTVSGALLVTQSDYRTAQTGVGATRAFHLAQAGLTRYIGERRGVPTDSAVYTMGGGTVVVKAARVAAYGIEEVYEISSSATLSSTGGSIERRQVRQLAVLELRPFQPLSAIATTARNVTLAGSYNGNDQSSSGACQAAARGNVAGLTAVAGGTMAVGSTLNGNPASQLEADTAAFRARLSAEWDELLDPATPVDYEVPAEPWPSFASLPASEYPTVRVTGDLAADATRSGRGLLIVSGRLALGHDFTWDGAILAGDLVYPTRTNAIIRGTLVLGMAQDAGASVDIGPSPSGGSATMAYDACSVLAAARGVARLRLVRNTWSEPAGW